MTIGNTMKYIVFLLTLMFSPSLFAQGFGGVQQSGSVTIGNCTSWAGNNVIQDAGSACGGGGSSGISIGTTTITGGTSTRILYDNAGVAGEYTITGSGTTVVLSTSPTFTTGITTPLVIGVTNSLGLQAASGTSNITIGTSQISTNEKIGIGTATLRNSAEADVNGILNVSSQSIGGVGTPSDSSGTWSTDYSTGNQFSYQLVHGETVTISNPSAGIVGGASGILRIIQSSTGSDTITTWGSDYKFQGGVAPTLSTAANAIDLLSYVVVGTNVINVSLIGTNYH